MKISKIIATLVGCVIAPVVSVFLSYSLDVMLTTQEPVSYTHLTLPTNREV